MHSVFFTCLSYFCLLLEERAGGLYDSEDEEDEEDEEEEGEDDQFGSDTEEEEGVGGTPKTSKKKEDENLVRMLNTIHWFFTLTACVHVHVQCCIYTITCTFNFLDFLF